MTPISDKKNRSYKSFQEEVKTAIETGNVETFNQILLQYNARCLVILVNPENINLLKNKTNFFKDFYKKILDHNLHVLSLIRTTPTASESYISYKI